ncbi:hypothetical protein niasHS_000725 [Heterodera schachtii]|uniref:Dynein heavy chain n=1 Tax=Heterodera schachtii TaxID=97005 RepID=A0ABD2KBI1_HETSC
MNRRWICNDVWMDIFPSFDHAQLGLKLALLSPRFNALVDKHFDGKRELTIWREIEIRRKDKGPEPILFVRINDRFVPFPLPDRPLPSKIRFKRLLIKYIDHSVIAFLRSNRQIFDKRGTNLHLLRNSSPYSTDGQRIWAIFVRELWPFFSTNIHHLDFYDGNHLDNLLRRTSPTILTDLLNLISIKSFDLLPAAFGDDFDGPNSTISAGQALSKWLHTPRKDGKRKRVRCALLNEQEYFDWVNNFKEHFLRANAISSVSYQINFFVRVPSMQMVPFELVNELTKEKLTLAKAKKNALDDWIMKRYKIIGETAAVHWEENWNNNCNNVGFWLDIHTTNCIGPLSAPPSAEEDEEALTGVCNNIDKLKQIPWLSVQSRKLRQNLEELLAKLKGLPLQYRSYESYDNAKRLLQNYLKMNSLIIELKSDLLKKRHWRNLTREMHVNWVLSELTLGQVWDIDLSRHEETIKKIMIVAHGERVLEDYLRQVKDYWTNYSVDLVNYQQKPKLIRGWDDLFNKLKQHMSNLVQMKLSPYYKQFEEDALLWEEKLNKMNTIFNSWIDVQRRWVYLEGLFTASADIAQLLPSESNSFNMVSNEFLGLMRKVSTSPRILDVICIQDLQEILERLADKLSEIQKAPKIQKPLGEYLYLERERNSFPRFYFVGDEDLLEILGNSKDLTRVQKHFKKMFAGIMAVEFNEQSRTISAIISREGESVKLKCPVDLEQLPKIEWLRELEREMQSTLATLLGESLLSFSKLDIENIQHEDLMVWMDLYPDQIIGICVDVWWSKAVESCLSKHGCAENVQQTVEKWLSMLCKSVLRDQTAIRRKKISNLITEFMHKKNVCRQLVKNNVKNKKDFWWLKNLRIYFKPKAREDPRKACFIKMDNAEFLYGFEYLGIQEKLVQTPLTDRCYHTMTDALQCRIGGSPFGPAGTGKTESVKALGHQLGRFVLVFNCDETFDFQAVGRILAGLCQVGAWGCFDEFNRLEERMLSAVSQQIQMIQETVRAGSDMKVDLVGKSLTVNPNMAIFITMNAGYSGRYNLPDNLEQLFCSFAMTSPNLWPIAEVMLFSQGFEYAQILGNKMALLFTLCKEQLSNQCHYDFGLRALKYVLVSAGNIKRDAIQRFYDEASQSGDGVGEQTMARQKLEQQMLIQSVCETLTPKLVSEDITLLQSLLHDEIFPGISYSPKQVESLKNEVVNICKTEHLSCSPIIGEKGNLWLEKVLQVYQIANLKHGLMLVGASGSGKTTAWKTLLKALENHERVEGVSHVIVTKSISKDTLYGTLDPNTRKWTDGKFTRIIRKIIDNVHGELGKRQWIIFDGDVDPEWVENLNSVLDDNKLLTLPNGERLSIPPNVRIIFEVADLKFATMATVSRCGMVWFSEDVVTPEMRPERKTPRHKKTR